MSTDVSENVLIARKTNLTIIHGRLIFEIIERLEVKRPPCIILLIDDPELHR